MDPLFCLISSWYDSSVKRGKVKESEDTHRARGLGEVTLVLRLFWRFDFFSLPRFAGVTSDRCLGWPALGF